jgi:hypothetical protein
MRIIVLAGTHTIRVSERRVSEFRFKDGGGNHPKTDEGVEEVRDVPEAVGAARDVTNIEEGTAAQNTGYSGFRASRVLHLLSGATGVFFRIIPVGAPFPNIANHLVRAARPGIMRVHTNRRGRLQFIIWLGVVASGRVPTVAPRPGEVLRAAGGLFPLGFGR